MVCICVALLNAVTVIVDTVGDDFCGAWIDAGVAVIAVGRIAVFSVVCTAEIIGADQ